MQTNLAKLKLLKEDDKTENALLRSRIEEQSQLIMMLKQRTDDSILKIQTLTRLNEELQLFRDSAGEKFEKELKYVPIFTIVDHETMSYHNNTIIYSFYCNDSNICCVVIFGKFVIVIYFI